MNVETKCDPGGCGACGKEDSAVNRPKYPHSLKALILFVKNKIEYSKVTNEWDLLFNVCFLSSLILPYPRRSFPGDWNAIGTRQCTSCQGNISS
jgi:hypothetical protein